MNQSQIMQSQASVLDEKQIDFKDILSSISIQEKNGCLLVPFGQKDNGELLVEDLAAIPHIIVSGFTGSGKTTFIQTLFLIAASKYSSDIFQLCIFDSKQVDYGFMNKMPHLLRPVCTTVNDTSNAFWDWLYEEEKRRYNAFSSVSVQDISSFNSVSDARLPHLFIIIDDINSSYLSSETVGKINSIISIARRAGVHFFIVSSSVSSKEMPKEIASSITARIAFKSISKAESKAAIGIYGAEFLETPGEILYKGNNGSLLKLHTVYMPFEEAVNTVASLSQKSLSSLADLQKMATSLFTENAIDSSKQENITTSKDSLFDKAVSVCVESGQASISLLQSSLRISFMRAVQLMDELEKAKIVSPSDGINPRTVLVSSGSDSQVQEDNHDDSDDMFTAAVEVVLDAGQATTSMLQRRLRLGYARAARLLDEMEQAGIISEQEGSKPRRVIISKRQWNERTVSNTKQIISDNDKEADTSDSSVEENSPDVHLRPFPYTSVAGGGFSVSNNQVHLHKSIQTKLGPATTDPQFDGKVISAIIFRKASVLSKGFFTFEVKPTTPITFGGAGAIWDVNHNNFAEQMKIVISTKDNKVVALFIKQLSEDLSIPITFK